MRPRLVVWVRQRNNPYTQFATLPSLVLLMIVQIAGFCKRTVDLFLEAQPRRPAGVGLPHARTFQDHAPRELLLKLAKQRDEDTAAAARYGRTVKATATGKTDR